MECFLNSLGEFTKKWVSDLHPNPANLIITGIPGGKNIDQCIYFIVNHAKTLPGRKFFIIFGHTFMT